LHIEAAEAAAMARRQFARALVKANHEPGAAVLMAQILTTEHYCYLSQDAELTLELLDVNPDTFNDQDPIEVVAAYVAKGARNAQRAAYAAGLAMGEASMTSYASWGRRAYCDHLVAAGYQLTDLEAALLANDTADDDYEEDYDDSGSSAGGQP